MGFSTALKNYMLDQAGTSKALYLSLHSADPGTTGTAELVGGSPAYARKAATWNAASGGVKTLTGTVTFDVPAGATVAYVGVWDSTSGGNWMGGGPLSSSETYTAQGVYTYSDPVGSGTLVVGG